MALEAGAKGRREDKNKYGGNKYADYIVMMILWVHIYVKTQQAIYFKYVQLIANYTSMKLFKNVLKSSTMAFMAFLMKSMLFTVYSVQFSSVAQSCPTLCDPRNHSTPGLLGHHQLPEFTQTHVH